MGIADRAGTFDFMEKDEQDRLINMIANVLDDLQEVLIAAYAKHGDMASPHEGHSVTREELEELWDHVKADTGRTPEARKEALQVAAMACRYVIDLIDKQKEPDSDYLN